MSRRLILWAVSLIAGRRFLRILLHTSNQSDKVSKQHAMASGAVNLASMSTNLGNHTGTKDSSFNPRDCHLGIPHLSPDWCLHCAGVLPFAYQLLRLETSHVYVS